MNAGIEFKFTMTVIDQTYFERRECPICGGPVTVANREIVASSPRAEDLPPEQLGRFLSDYDSQRVLFTYRECGACRACICPFYFTQEQLDTLYANQPENIELAPLEARTRTQASYLSILEPHAQMEGLFLELGADIGLFAEACEQADKFEQFIVYEPNVTTHDAIGERMRDYKVDVRGGRFHESDIEPSSISVGVMIHVLDHILNPFEMLSGICECLEPGGTLFVVTHNRSSLLARMLGKRWPPFTMQHPHLFTPTTMQTLLKRAGFDRISTHPTSNSFPATFLVRAGLSTLGLDYIPIPYWTQPLVHLPLGNFAIVAHRS